MFVRLFEGLFREISLVLKMFRSFFTRIFTTIITGIRKATSLVTQAFKLIPMMTSKLATTGKKPSRREDYIETKRLFISKSLIFFIIIAVLLIALAGWFLVRPLLVRWFFTADFYYLDKDVEDYTGKVRLFYDVKRENLKFKGKLESGVITGDGEEYSSDVSVVYSGGYVDGQYEGSGKLWENGTLVYSGQFSGGERNGEGSEYIGGTLFYRGAFEKGVYSGDGAEYDSNGIIIFRGQYSAGKRNGKGTEYYPGEDHVIKYSGEYLDGLMDGDGILCGSDGDIIYDGSFRGGYYSGSGTLYTGGAGNYLEAVFERGIPTGEVRLYTANKLVYSGEIDTGSYLANGFGTLYNDRGGEVFTGQFADGMIDGSALLGISASELRDTFEGSTLTETDGENGFVISCEALGITAYCSYKTDTEDALIRYVSLSPSGADASIAEAVGTGYFEEYTVMEADDIITAIIPLISSSDYYASVTVGDDYLEIAWSEDPETEKLLIEWCSVSGGGSQLSEIVSNISEDDKSALNAEKRLRALLDALKLNTDSEDAG